MFPKLPVKYRNEVGDQQRDIFPPAAQRWESDGIDCAPPTLSSSFSWSTVSSFAVFSRIISPDILHDRLWHLFVVRLYVDTVGMSRGIFDSYAG